MIRLQTIRSWPRIGFAIVAFILLHLVFPQTAGAQAVPNPDSQVRETWEAPQLSYGAQADTRLPAPQRIEAKSSLIVTVTAYSSTPEETDGDPFTTASGTHVHDGTIAHNSLPFGTRVRFPDHFGDKVFTVEDRMNSRYGPYMADIWFPSKSEALQWGKRTVRMEIL